MLIVAPSFVTAGAIEDALLAGKVAGEAHSALIVQPGIQAFLSLLVISATIKIHDHHARFIAEGPVAERAHTGKTPFAARFVLAVDEQMAGVSPVEFIEHRFGRPQLGALVQAPPPVTCHGLEFPIEAQPIQGGALGLASQHQIGHLDHHPARLSRVQRQGPLDRFSLPDRGPRRPPGREADRLPRAVRPHRRAGPGRFPLQVGKTAAGWLGGELRCGSSE